MKRSRSRRTVKTQEAPIPALAKALLSLALCALLGGCYFMSAQPLFAPERGACPFAAEERFETVQADPEAGPLPDGADRPTLRIATHGAHCLAERSDEPEVERLLFVPLRRGAWIVQSETDSALYFIARLRGDRLSFHFPDCDHFSESRLRRLGVVTEDDAGRSTCLANDARQIEILFRSWRMRAPVQIYRRIES
ncbi:MAG: hypothetical protein NW203_07895 [Hyphomonadaceae bacterium]|nr:hypothetical protein [Hyphomonadaceae bacterium]